MTVNVRPEPLDRRRSTSTIVGIPKAPAMPPTAAASCDLLGDDLSCDRISGIFCKRADVVN